MVAPVHKLPCRPGRGMLVASGAEKDDLLVLGQVRKLGLKLLKGERAFKLHGGKILFSAALLKKCLIDALDVGKVGQLIEYHPEVRLMGVTDTQVFSLGAADPSRGSLENLDGWVYPAHLSLVPRITRNAKFIV
ncbi:MAG: hypothetical protein P8X58_14970 [Syntrophobacterales bacterium]